MFLPVADPSLIWEMRTRKEDTCRIWLREKKIGAYCQTEPNAGSDAGNLSSFAEEKDTHYLLNGEKIFISNAKIASVLIVLAKTKIVPEKTI